MGKSTVGDLLQRHGVATVDADAVSRQLTQPGQPALAEIARRFGASVCRPDGGLNREELARVVFADPAARADLEDILHPAIRARWEAEVGRWRAEGRERGAVIIPLLFETKAENLFDATICVACSPATQQARLRERGWPPGQISGRIAAQWPVEKKIARSYFVIWTDTEMDVTEAQLLRIIDSAGRPQKIPVCA
jgi:dephospho-CoA kinase